MSKLASLLVGITMLSVSVFAVSPVLAQEAPTGQFEGGNIYRAANVTKGIDFTDPVTATCGDTVQFRVRIHNIGAFPATGVKVQATLPSATATSHSSTVTVSSPNSNTVTDTAGVTLNPAGKLTYVAGSTELLDANQSKLGNLADGIVAGGVTLADPVGVSTQQKRSVQFQVKVTCDTVEVPKDIKVCELATRKIITIKENEFDATKHTLDLSKCDATPVPPTTPPTPTTLVDTGAGDVFGIFAAITVAGAMAHRLVLSRRNG